MKKRILAVILIVLCLLSFSACTSEDVQDIFAKWQQIESVGNTDNSISIQEATSDINIPSPSADTDTFTVKRVVDGDTFIVIEDNEEIRVRMIGIDTPESVSSDSSKNCEYGKFVSEYTKTKLEGKSVELEYDTDKIDTYGRTLAYVYIDNKLFNCTLVENGYAVAREYPPNVKYSKVFTSAQIKAQQVKAGMWSDDVSEQECNLKSKYYINY